MIYIKVNVIGIDETVKGLDRVQRMISKAVINGINKTAYHVWDALRSEMIKSFDRPTSYMLNSLLVKKATSNNPIATIMPDDLGKGTKPSNILIPQIFGGKRNDKRSEIALKQYRILPKGMSIVPGKGANIDQYGNMSVGQIRQILSFFSAAEMTRGYSSNMTAKGKARLAKGSKKKGIRGFQYFAVRSKKSHLAQGIYKRASFGKWGSSITPILMFVKQPQYRRRYKFFETADVIIRTRLLSDYSEALKELGAYN